MRCKAPRLGRLDLRYHLAHTYRAFSGAHRSIYSSSFLGCLFLVGNLLDSRVHCSRKWWRHLFKTDDRGVGIRSQPLLETHMDQTRRDQIASMHDSQRQRAATYKPTVPEIPTKHGCAGECSMPPPPVPLAARLLRRDPSTEGGPPYAPPVSNETFITGPADLPREWWLLMGSVSVVYLILCLRRI
jgi:hypothetical protein